jgi:pyruvate dehydrogenase E2 component (dihydrolipoamide acetyltransferase)
VAVETIKIPDIGGAEGVDVIEICVAVGDTVAAEDDLLVLESDKASMDIPAPKAGVVKAILVKVGDKVSQGTPMMELESASAETAAPVEAAVPKSAQPGDSKENNSSPAITDITVPDIGGAQSVDVIELCVSVGDTVKEGDSLVVLESDKASMEIPAPASGKITSLSIKVGDKASQGTLIGQMASASAAKSPPAQQAPAAEPIPRSVTPQPPKPEPVASVASIDVPTRSSADVYAGPAVRKFARHMAVDLAEVVGTGPRGRITSDDVKVFVKSVMQQRSSGAGTATNRSGIPAVPVVDFSKFGEVELQKMNKIKQLTAEAMTRNWLNIPRVTQFDDADITDIETFRKDIKAEAEKAGVKLTPLPFIIKAVAAALQAEPSFNVAVHSDAEQIVQKKYIHISVAVDTPRGLMVPVIRDVDKKGLYEISKELVELAAKARDGKLKPDEMQGGCFTISSLGPIGGTGFTPMVSTTEAGILGVSKAVMKPVWDGAAFQPRLMLPLSLSYDHRAVNGSDAGRFLTFLSTVLGDVRRLLL